MNTQKELQNKHKANMHRFLHVPAALSYDPYISQTTEVTKQQIFIYIIMYTAVWRGEDTISNFNFCLGTSPP